MRRTIFDHTPDGLRQRLADMERQIADLQRVRNPPATYVEVDGDDLAGGAGAGGNAVSGGTQVDPDVGGWAGSPSGWTDGDAHWIWHDDPTDQPDESDTWLVATYNALGSRSVTIEAAADNSASVYLNGDLILSVPDYHVRSTATATLQSGENQFAVKAHNTTASGSINPAGFIMSVRDATSGAVLLRTNPSSWYAYATEPDGWPTPGNPSGDLSINDLSDVDTATSGPANGDALVWDSGSAQWRPRAVAGGGGGGGHQLITSSALASDAAYIEFSGIPASYSDLVMTIEYRSTRASTNDGVVCRLGNGSVDTGSNYKWRMVAIGAGPGTTTSAADTRLAIINYGPAAQSTAGIFAWGEVTIWRYTAAEYRRVTSVSYNGQGTTTNMSHSFGEWLNATDAVDVVRIFPLNGPNFAAGTRAFLYGR